MGLFDAGTRKKRAKKAVVLFLIIFGLYSAIHFFIWNRYTAYLLTKENILRCGDLARTGYLTGSLHFREYVQDLPNKHLEFKQWDGGKVDVITIGDSFSNGNVRGYNAYWQDYLASLHDLRILNIRPLKDKTGVETIATLLNSGFIKKSGAKHIIVEDVERYVFERYGREIKFDEKQDLSEIRAYYIKISKPNPLPEYAPINSGNLKFLLYNTLYQFDDNAYFSDVYIADLKKKMFSIKQDSRLLFFKDDLWSIKETRDEHIAKANENMNHLADMLAQYNVKLYFMPAVNKLTLYAKYLVDNNYPLSEFFEKIRPLEKRYLFIDTKALLEKEVEAGELDIFYADDTHWSWKANKKIAENIVLQKDSKNL